MRNSLAENLRIQIHSFRENNKIRNQIDKNRLCTYNGINSCFPEALWNDRLY